MQVISVNDHDGQEVVFDRPDQVELDVIIKIVCYRSGN